MGGLGPSWGQFEGSWAHVGSKLGAPETMLVPRGGLSGHVGSKREVLGAMLAHCLAFSKDVQICINFSSDCGSIFNGFLIPRNLNFNVLA